MNIFDILGYTTSSSYPLESITSVGNFALIVSGEPPPPSASNIYYGNTNILSIYYGSTPINSIYYGSTKVF